MGTMDRRDQITRRGFLELTSAALASGGQFAEDGYTNVESMYGGWKGWIGAGLPTQKG